MSRVSFRREMAGRRSLRFNWVLWTFAAAGMASYLAMALLDSRYGTLRAQVTPQTIFWYLIAFAAFLAAVVWAERRPPELKWIWILAICYRLPLLWTHPTLSDDVYRYMWDGYLANQGVSPYAQPINSPDLDYLEIPLRRHANNPGMASPYLPAAQAVFFVLARYFPLEPLYFQLAMVLFDLVSGALIAGLLAMAALPARRVMLYLWNPLVIVEVAHGAHLDAWMVALTTAAVLLTIRPRSSRDRFGLASLLSPVLLALATLTKIVPFLALAVLYWRWSWRQLLVYGLVVAALLLPAGVRAGWGLRGPLEGIGLFGAVRIYADRWRFNPGPFAWISAALERIGFPDPLLLSKQISLLLLGLVMLVVWRAARRRRDIRSHLRLMAIPFMAYLLLSTTVHPWYLLSLTGFLPFLAPGDGESWTGWLLATPWLYLNAAVGLSYLTYLDPQNFRELTWVRAAEWVPTVGLLALAVIVLARNNRYLPQQRAA